MSEKVNWQKVLFRCSSLGKIMTEPREKDKRERGVLSTTCTSYLDEFADEVEWGTSNDKVSRYITKGLEVEPDSITLYSLFKQSQGEIFFTTNVKERLNNEFITGLPDCIVKDKVLDVKSSWDSNTFRKAKNKINKLYYWQLQGYMALTGLKKATLAYCLIDTPEPLIQDEIKRAAWKSGTIDDSNPAFQEIEMQIRTNMTFSNRPLHRRVYEVNIEINAEDVAKIYKRVSQCRNWLEKNYPQ